MKELSLTIDYSDFDSFERTISLLRDENFDLIKITINTTKKLERIELKRIIKAEDSFNTTVFQNIIVLPFCLFVNHSYLRNLRRYHIKLLFDLDTAEKYSSIVIKKKLKKLKRKKIESAVRIKEVSGGIKGTIDNLNFGNVKYYFENVDYSNECIEYFRQWIFDKKAPYINFFDDIINNVLLKTVINDCSHSSCLGKELYLSKDKVFSFCRIYPSKTILANLSDINNLNDVFEQRNLLSIIKNSINKRNICLNDCKYYDVCKGGCPLLSSEKCNEKNFVALYNEISETMLAIIKSDNLDIYNIHIRNAILKYIVFENTNI